MEASFVKHRWEMRSKIVEEENTEIEDRDERERETGGD